MLQQPLWITVLFVYYFHFTDDENKVLILSDFPNDTVNNRVVDNLTLSLWNLTSL